MNPDQLHDTADDDPRPVGAPRPSVAGAVVFGRSVLTSGQTAHLAGVNVAMGHVGGSDGIDLATARRAARVCARNAVEALRGELGSLDRIERVLRMNVWVASAPEFGEQHLVADAATDYVLEVFGPAGHHTRAALGVAALPTLSPVEVDLLVELREP